MNRTSRRDFLKVMGLGSAALTWPGCAGLPGSGAAGRPNVLFLFSDDQRFDTIGALNNSEIRTPNLDRLVRRGTAFTRAHIMGGTSGAVCMPSRAMLLTGRSLFHLQDRGAGIPEEHALLPEIFRSAGYRTFGTGKWHNGRRAYARSFSHGGKIMFGGMSDHLKVPLFDFDPTGEYPKKRKYIGSGFSSTIFSDETIRFIENDIGDDPFFAYVSYTAPHDPRMAPKEYADLYPPEGVGLPKNFMPAHPFENGEMRVRDEKLAPFPRTEKVVREHLAAYYAMITHMDAEIGRILDALDRSGKASNTIIVFSGDNGVAVGCHGLLGKQNIYDHSVRVPLIVCGPGIPQGGRAEGLCFLNDLFPTLCDLADLDTPASVEGKSLVPMLRDPGRRVRDSVFLAYRKFQRGIRTDDDWKLIKYCVRGETSTQLFDLNSDPHELHNLAGEARHAVRQTALESLLTRRMKELDDFCRLDEPGWGLPESTNRKRKVKHAAKGKKITLASPVSPKYDRGGPDVLVDGIRGTTDFHDGAWQGFEGTDLDAKIDLGKARPVARVKAGFIDDQASWIFLPLFMEVAISDDGSDFRTQQIVECTDRSQGHIARTKEFSAVLSGVSARYVRVRAKSMGKCPAWHAGAGGKAWLFVDEIMIE